MHLPRIDPPVPEAPKDVHLSPPFVQIEGVLNCRALPLQQPNPWLFRSGDISSITPKGATQLQSYGIRTIFDFRSPSEIEKSGRPVAVIEGVQIVQAPLLHDPKDDPKHAWHNDENVRKMYAEYRVDPVGEFMKGYSCVLEQGSANIGSVLRCLCEREDGAGVLFHCSAGKDRAGVVSALILSLAGVEDTAIVHDYALTMPGLAPFAEVLLKRFSGDRSFQEETEGAMHVFSSRPETMQAFLDVIRDKFGGAEAYARDVAGLSQAEVDTLKNKLSG